MPTVPATVKFEVDEPTNELVEVQVNVLPKVNVLLPIESFPAARFSVPLVVRLLLRL